jgi:hypothetical protein
MWVYIKVFEDLLTYFIWAKKGTVYGERGLEKA